jgi:secernin
MAGTILITPQASADNALYLAKNSNRNPGECQPVIALPPVKRSLETRLDCTYITIAQAASRHGIVLSKPWWSWGGEMGANDQGVVIACEAVATRNHEPEPGLIGMDLVRLGLERAGTADDALDIIVALLLEHGQGGTCRYGPPPYSYDSSFVIGDANAAWLLETAGRHWAARRIKNQAITSARLELTTDYDRSSYALNQYAQVRGWAQRDEDVHFSDTFSRGYIGGIRENQQRLKSLTEGIANLETEYPHLALMQLLRRRRNPHPGRASKRDIALHAGGPFRRLQTTGSMVVRVSARKMDAFFTGTAAPDLSIFKPVHVDLPLESELPTADFACYYEGSLWWRQERLNRRIRTSRPLTLEYFHERDELEQKMVMDLAIHKGRSLKDIQRQIQVNLLEWQDTWREKYPARKSLLDPLFQFNRFWRRQSRLDGAEF